MTDNINDGRPPLGMPHGSVRAIIALGIIVGAFVMLGIDKLDFEQFMAVTSLPVGFYFGQYVKSQSI